MSPQALLQQRMDELGERYLFLRELFQHWKDCQQLPVLDERRVAQFAYLQEQSLHFRQAQQQFRLDLQQERKRRRGD